MLLTAVFVLQSEQDWRQEGIWGTLEILKYICDSLCAFARASKKKITGEYY